MDEEHIAIAEWSAVLDHSSYYEILGVLEIADDEALRDAFHQFSLAFHPDRHRGADRELVADVTRIFQRGAEAYRVLTDPELRVRYDMGLAKGQLRLVMRRTTPPPGTTERVQPLHELCRSPGAKLAAQKADKLLAVGDLQAAKREIERALEYDGGNNSALTERLDALAVALYAQGD